MQVFPLVSIVILNFNGLKYLKALLKECLDSVLKTDYPNLEILFVDNGSTDGSSDFVRKNYSPNIKIVQNRRNLGFAEGFNTGIRATKGKYIALLSNDMTVDPKWIQETVKFMEKEHSVGITGFKRLMFGKTNVLDGIGGNLDLAGYVRVVGKGVPLQYTKKYDRVIYDLDYIGGAMVLRREMLKKIGLFDADYIVFSEDIDLCCRARKDGYKLAYVPTAIIWHVGQATFNAMDSTNSYSDYMSNRSRIRFNIIHFSIPRLLVSVISDLEWFTVSNLIFKRSLLEAYWWNLKNIPTTIKKRLQCGHSPFSYRWPIFYTRAHKKA